MAVEVKPLATAPTPIQGLGSRMHLLRPGPPSRQTRNVVGCTTPRALLALQRAPSTRPALFLLNAWFAGFCALRFAGCSFGFFIFHSKKKFMVFRQQSGKQMFMLGFEWKIFVSNIDFQSIHLKNYY